MGANCCIAAKQRPQPCIIPVEVSAYRNVRHSPSWSFRWDNRTHIEDIMEIPTFLSNHSSGSIRPETKSGSIAPTEGFSNGGSPSELFHKVKWQKSEKKTETSKVAQSDPRADKPTASNSSPEAKLCRKSLDMVSVASDTKASSTSVPSTPPVVSRADPSSSRGHSLGMDTDSMRKARRSPGYQLYRQVSDSKIPSLRSLNESNSPEGRPSSSMLSVCSNDLSVAGSHGESSDGWSMRTFSEMVASSQRERWSIDSELLGSVSSKMTRSNASNRTTVSPDQEVCKLCLKLLKERSAWNAQDLGVVAVLLCGHVYHADCLDSLTAEAEKYDPPCPVCTHGEQCTVKLFGKLESKIKNKIPTNVILDDLDGSSKHQKKNKRVPRLGTSISMKDSFSRPFLRRHFSIGSRPPRLASESESTRKRGFWARHWRE